MARSHGIELRFDTDLGDELYLYTYPSVWFSQCTYLHVLSAVSVCLCHVTSVSTSVLVW